MFGAADERFTKEDVPHIDLFTRACSLAQLSVQVKGLLSQLFTAGVSQKKIAILQEGIVTTTLYQPLE